LRELDEEREREREREELNGQVRRLKKGVTYNCNTNGLACITLHNNFADFCVFVGQVLRLHVEIDRFYCEVNVLSHSREFISESYIHDEEKFKTIDVSPCTSIHSFIAAQFLIKTRQISSRKKVP